MKKGLIILLITLIAAGIVLSMFCFTINETEQVVITRFGEITKIIVPEENYELVKEQLSNDERFTNIDIEKGRGIFFKVPFIDTIQKYSSQMYIYDTSPREVITLDKKKIILDNSAQWNIINPALFKVSIGSTGGAQTRIDDLLYSKLNEKVGRVEATILISDKQYMSEMLTAITEENNEVLHTYGINISYTRIKCTDFPQENNSNIFNRMIAERQQKATLYRSEGEEQALVIKSSADKEAAIIEAEATKQAAIIRGEADATAAAIYNEAYSVDPEFYAFYRTLLAYKNTVPASDATIIIDNDSPFAKYLFGD